MDRLTKHTNKQTDGQTEGQCKNYIALTLDNKYKLYVRLVDLQQKLFLEKMIMKIIELKIYDLFMINPFYDLIHADEVFDGKTTIPLFKQKKSWTYLSQLFMLAYCLAFLSFFHQNK